MACIALQNLSKSYDQIDAVKCINLEIDHNEFIVLVGPSGCGKSTTLRMIAGLEDPSEGDILIDDKWVNNVPSKDRNIAMVFQNYGLYPQKSVYDNIAFSLMLKKLPKAEIDRKVKEAADILGISDLLDRRPKQLSGGERQRVAMGRSIVRNPQVFLFDEPLSNLDAKMRTQMRTEIKKMHQRVETTIIFVTHDQVEAMTLADRIVVMNNGKIEQVGTPQELYDNPKTLFVAGFIGTPAMNFTTGKIVETNDVLSIQLGNQMSLALPKERYDRYQKYLGGTLTFGIRPEHVTEKRRHINATQVDFDATVQAVEPMGMDTLVYMDMDGIEMNARTEPKAVLGVGESMSFTINMSHMHLLDPKTELIV
jgi:multiple sugar transport system ATP-binding protein